MPRSCPRSSRPVQSGWSENSQLSINRALQLRLLLALDVLNQQLRHTPDDPCEGGYLGQRAGNADHALYLPARGDGEIHPCLYTLPRVSLLNG